LVEAADSPKSRLRSVLDGSGAVLGRLTPFGVE
jgi:hypothetical protein